MNYMALGAYPAAWRAEKIALELVAVALVFRAAQLIAAENAVGLLAALFFACLPGTAESVLWTSAIGEPLSTVFELGALCCVIRRGARPRIALAAASILYAGALLSHETAVLFCLIVLAYLVMVERRALADSVRIAAPFFVLAALYLCARKYSLGDHFLGLPHFLQDAINVRFGWEGPTPAHGMRDVMLTAPSVLLTYLGVMFVPGVAAPAHDVHWIASAGIETFVPASPCWQFLRSRHLRCGAAPIATSTCSARRGRF